MQNPIILRRATTGIIKILCLLLGCLLLLMVGRTIQHRYLSLYNTGIYQPYTVHTPETTEDAGNDERVATSSNTVDIQIYEEEADMQQPPTETSSANLDAVPASEDAAALQEQTPREAVSSPPDKPTQPAPSPGILPFTAPAAEVLPPITYGDCLQAAKLLLPKLTQQELLHWKTIAAGELTQDILQQEQALLQQIITTRCTPEDQQALQPILQADLPQVQQLLEILDNEKLKQAIHAYTTHH